MVELVYVIGEKKGKRIKDPFDWKIVEGLAEQYPCVTALLNISKDYMCTGVVINKRTVLTSGSCIDPALHFIALGSAVLSRSVSHKSLMQIANSVLHVDYIFELWAHEPNTTRVHSNIGLVFSVLPYLDAFLSSVDLGNYFASELQEKAVKVVGYGKINGTNTVVLQQQIYHQSPCTNPKWYYCICGVEFLGEGKTYEGEFGKGAPVFLGTEVVGIAAAPSGVMKIEKSSKSPIKYNIFTVIGPFLPWVDKASSNYTGIFRAHSGSQRELLHYVCIVLVTIEVLFH